MEVVTLQGWFICGVGSCCWGLLELSSSVIVLSDLARFCVSLSYSFTFQGVGADINLSAVIQL